MGGLKDEAKKFAEKAEGSSKKGSSSSKGNSKKGKGSGGGSSSGANKTKRAAREILK